MKWLCSQDKTFYAAGTSNLPKKKGKKKVKCGSVRILDFI
jgi:hypothetical protein